MKVCKRVLYEGQVQGVGFRYTARGLAEDFQVDGFVRNLPDGRVELQAEGDSDQVQGFLNALGRQMAHHVRRQTVEDNVPCGAKGFVIRPC